MSRSIVVVSDAGTGEITVFTLDLRSGALSARQRVALGGKLMPLALGPGHTRLYVARRSDPLAVVSLAIDGDGLLTPIAEAALPDSMAFIATDASGRFLLSASYGGHRVAVSRIDAHGRAGAATQVVSTEPNAHAIRADPANRHVFSTSLGGQLLRRFDFDATSGTLAPHAEPRVPVETVGPHPPGPRHFVFHPTRPWLYLLNELDASIARFDYDAASAGLAPRQRVFILPPGFDGEPWAAELRLAPDGRHLYASERRSSTLAAFSIDDASGELAGIGHVPTEAQPRGFAIDPGGRWLVVAGELSGGLRCHAIDAASGRLAEGSASLVFGAAPTWVEIIALPC